MALKKGVSVERDYLCKILTALQYTPFLNVQKKVSMEDTFLLPQGNSEQHWNLLRVFSWTKADSSNGLQFTDVTPKAFSLIWTENHNFF